MIKNNLVTPQIRVEKRKPQSGSLKLVDEIARMIETELITNSESFREYVKYHRERIAFDIDYTLEYIPSTSKILEVGTDPLLFTGCLSKLGYDFQGIDFAPERKRHISDKMGVNIIKCNIELDNLPFSNNSFDTIIFNEVFEHLRINLIFTLSEILRVLKPNGVLFLSTPNLRSVEGIINFLKYEKSYSCMGGDIYKEYKYAYDGGVMGHVREYTATEVCQFLKRIGFSIREVIYRGQYKRRSYRLITKLMPNLRPFMTIVATKPEEKIA